MKRQVVKVPKTLLQRCNKDNCSPIRLLGNNDWLLNYRKNDYDNGSQCHRNGFRRRPKSYSKNQETAVMSFIFF